MDFLRMLEGIRTPLLDKLFYGITVLGEETSFLVFCLLLYWCADKKLSRYLIAVGFSGTIMNQWLKIVCRIPRPWVLDENFTIVESARAGATGYSFPSGHTQFAVGFYGGIARSTKKTWLRVLMIIMAILVGFSRMYLGVHTPQDVLTASATSVALVFAFYPLLYGKKASIRKSHWLFLAIFLYAVAFAVYMSFSSFPADVDQANLASAVKNAWTLLGATVGIWQATELDDRKIHFETKAPFAAQVIKFLGGIAIVMAIRFVSKPVLQMIFGSHPSADAIRYFLMTFVGAGLWPMTFKYIGRIGTPKEKNA